MILPKDAPTTALTLKTNTAHNHQLLEELLIPQLENCATLDEYAEVLKMFYGYFKPLEDLAEKFIDRSVLPDIHLRRKASLLIDDLKYLGRNESVLICTDQPKITNVFEALGALYVLEGSTLGGRGITKMMLKHNAALSLSNLSFFNGYGADTGPKWIAFQKVINSFTTKENVVQMVAAANDTFLKFKLWILQSAPTKR